MSIPSFDGDPAPWPRRQLLRDDDSVAPQPVTLGARRTTVLDWLRRSDEPMTAAGMAERTGLHLNTARFHLDGLVEQGYATRRSEDRDAPGRPRILYFPRATTTGQRSYRLLSQMLTGLVASLDHDGSAAKEAGRAWGRHLVEGAAPDERIDRTTALERLDTLMDDIGFEPETRAGGETEMHLHHCPFREVAEGNPSVVCALHLGLMQGALDELGTPVDVESLQPFATPQLCVARLRQGPGDDTGRRG
jgi:predicted ArsR family transcriptional regulator